MSNKYNKFSKAKIKSEREEIEACLDFILISFDRVLTNLDNMEKEVKKLKADDYERSTEAWLKKDHI